MIDLAGRRIGAVLLGDGRCLFRLWAPKARRVELIMLSPLLSHEMAPCGDGYFEVHAHARAGAFYRYRLDGTTELADPASLSQPEGVHGPSAIVPPFEWTDTGWMGIALEDYVFYELHIGTFSRSGTFEGAIGHLEGLRELGITAIELMPVAQFPGERNWGYDGVFPFAAQSTYGGPNGFRRLVDAAHARGLAVVLDVVYNHLGPEGNMLDSFGPYFTDRYRTPWGRALNFDGPGSDEVRTYFLENALYWLRDCHVDALRLDAVHAIVDHSAHPFLQEVAEVIDAASEALGRPLYAIAESDLNDPRLIRPRSEGGFGLHGQWNDDFHHAVHAVMTGEREGYYADFGRISQIVDTLNHGFAYRGGFSRYRQRQHGASTGNIPAHRFVVYAQNHDQVGNRFSGDRLTQRLTAAEQRFVAGLVILSPFLPLLFMGEEYGETAPFQYFVSHTDEELIEAVRRGRREEFLSFAWEGEAADPQAMETFDRCKLTHQQTDLRNFYSDLLGLRREFFHLHVAGNVIATLDGEVITIHHTGPGGKFQVFFNFGEKPMSIANEIATGWSVVLASEGSGGGDTVGRYQFTVLKRPSKG